MGLVGEGFREEVGFESEGCDWATGQEISLGRRYSLREDLTGANKKCGGGWVGVGEEALQRPRRVHRNLRRVGGRK